jgi:hypothetical protein
VTDDDLGDRRDPLLVRPYLLGSSGADAGDPSAQTWPAASPIPDVPARRPVDGADDPTELLVRPVRPARWPGGPLRRRVLVLVGVGAVVVLGAAAAGFAALNADMMPAGPGALPDDPLPAVTGPQTTPPAATGVVPGPPRPRHGASGVTATSTVGSPPPSSAAPSSTEASPTLELATAGTDPTSPGELAAPDPQTARTGPVRGQNGLCLDLGAGGAVDNAQVLMVGCTGSATQTWTLATDGTLRVSDKCAVRAGDSTVHIVGCVGQVQARWSTSGQLLINAADDGCLTDPSGGSRPGTGVLVAGCNGSAAQRWSLP